MPVASGSRGGGGGGVLTLIANLPEALGAITIFAVTMILFAGVIWRYFLANPLDWTDEVARAVFLWLSFLGAATAVKRRAHMSVAVLTSQLPAGWRRASELFALLTIAAVAMVMVVAGAEETRVNFLQVMPITGVSRGWMYLSIPVSGLLMLAYLAPQLRDAWRGVPPPAAHGHGSGGE